MGVSSTHPDYDRMVAKWTRCRDAASGQDAMRSRTIAAATKIKDRTVVNESAYIPALHEQPIDRYVDYVYGAPFFNATWRTIAGLNGMLFRKPLTVTAPAAVLPLLEDVTLCGEPFSKFGQSVGEETLKVGRNGVLVDYPSTMKLDVSGNVVRMNMYDAKEQNLRPTMRMYFAEDIINWDHRVINNAHVLSMVVLREIAPIPSTDRYARKMETQYRVLELDETGAYKGQLWRVDVDTGKDEAVAPEYYPEIAGKRLDYIPFQVFGDEDLSFDIDDPPLIDLVDMNIAHWRVSADYERGCHLSGLPTAVISGYKKKEGEIMYVGSDEAWIFPDPEASATYLETKGDLGALEKNLEAKEKRMAVLGARMLEPMMRGVETAETANIHRSGEQSMLSSTAETMSLGFTRVLQWFANWLAVAGKVNVEVNRKFFPMPMSPQAITALVSAWQFNGISQQTLFANLQRGEVIDEERTFDQESAAIANEMKLTAAANAAIVAAAPPALPNPLTEP